MGKREKYRKSKQKIDNFFKKNYSHLLIEINIKS